MTNLQELIEEIENVITDYPIKVGQEVTEHDMFVLLGKRGIYKTAEPIEEAMRTLVDLGVFVETEKHTFAVAEDGLENIRVNKMDYFLQAVLWASSRFRIPASRIYPSIKKYYGPGTMWCEEKPL